MLVGSGICEVGIGRKVNQDAMICEPERGLFAAIDGVGGCSDGKLAAEILQHKILEHCVGKPEHDKLICAFAMAHRKMVARIDGHTIITLQACASVIWLDPQTGNGLMGHVGDTRIYTRRHNGLHQHTRDHTFTSELPDEEARGYKRLLTNAVGAPHFLHDGPQISSFALAPDMLALILTDGLHGFALRPRIEQVVMVDDDVEKAARNAYHVGLDGQREHRMHGDNITVVAVRNNP